MPQFGKMKGMWRCHDLLAHLMDLGDQGEFTGMQAVVAQGLRAVHQVAIDHGKWSYAVQMLPMSDALGRPAFGGSEQELESIQAYRKGLADLRAKGAGTDKEEEKPPRKGDGKGETQYTKKQWQEWRKKQKGDGEGGDPSTTPIEYL